MLHIQFGSILLEDIVKSRRYVYFLRSSQEGIPPMESTEAATAEMPRYFIIGSCSGHFLRHIQLILKQVSRIYLWIFNDSFDCQ